MRTALLSVGAPGLEPGTSRTQTVRAIHLRYAPHLGQTDAPRPPVRIIVQSNGFVKAERSRYARELQNSVLE